MMQVIELLNLTLTAVIPVIMAGLILEGIFRGAKDIKNRALRTVYRLILCPLFLVCTGLALPALGNLVTLLFYITMY
jgi:Na+-driven multidrug efflux pump